MVERGIQPPIEFEVVNETTLSAASRLTQADGNANVLALNFASAKNPGAGFSRAARLKKRAWPGRRAFTPA